MEEQNEKIKDNEPKEQKDNQEPAASTDSLDKEQDHAVEKPAKESKESAPAKKRIGTNTADTGNIPPTPVVCQTSNPKSHSRIHLILTANVVVLTLVTAYLVLRPAPADSTAKTAVTVPSVPAQDSSQHTITLDKEITSQLDQAASLSLAEQLYSQNSYEQAYYVFDKLSGSFSTKTDENALINDFLTFKKALCMQKIGSDPTAAGLFTVASQSKSPFVKAASCYHLSIAELKNRHYLSARKKAYQAMSLVRAFEKSDSAFEADCYFAAVQALVWHALSLNNSAKSFTELAWPDLTEKNLPQPEQNNLVKLLKEGIEQLEAAALGPDIKKDRYMDVGSRYFAYSSDAPLQEFLSRFYSEAGIKLTWSKNTEEVLNRPVTAHLPASSEQFITEVITGSAGMIASNIDNGICIYNPESYDNLDDYKKIITNEAITICRRFLLRCRSDSRTPYVHYAIALLLDISDQSGDALSECRLISSRFSTSPAAPYALLKSSQIRTNIQDYEGAGKDLNDLLLHYPDSQLADKASIYLADATMKSGLYDQAAKMFTKVYNINMDAESRAQAAFGLGRCYYMTKQYTQAEKWLSTAIEMISDSYDPRLPTAWSMLGKTFVELEDYTRASAALKNAVGKSQPIDEYMQIIIALVHVEQTRGNFIDALDILENVPVEQLSQEHVCQITILKAGLYREIGVPETALSLVRRQIEFIADAKLRALLGLELAKTYVATSDMPIARSELVKAIEHLPAGSTLAEANLLLAQVCIALSEYQQAQEICRTILADHQVTPEQKRRAMSLLGLALTQAGEFDKAATVYAGQYHLPGANQ